MVSAISGLNSYYSVYRYSRTANLAADQINQTQNVKNSTAALTLHRKADPETPVQPIRPVIPVNSDEATPALLFTSTWAENYAVEQAVRFRIQSAASDSGDASGKNMAAAQPPTNNQLPAGLSADPVEMAVRMRIQYPDSLAESDNSKAAAGVEDIQRANDDVRCETCEKRKYQDGSDDPSVSFQTPTRIDPDAAASAVRGHEMEHVFHEQAKAEREDRKVVSQSVMLHTGICPECGRVYVSGGTTRTVTKADNEPDLSEQQDTGDNKND